MCSYPTKTVMYTWCKRPFIILPHWSKRLAWTSDLYLKLPIFIDRLETREEDEGNWLSSLPLQICLPCEAINQALLTATSHHSGLSRLFAQVGGDVDPDKTTHLICDWQWAASCWHADPPVWIEAGGPNTAAPQTPRLSFLLSKNSQNEKIHQRDKQKRA